MTAKDKKITKYLEVLHNLMIDMERQNFADELESALGELENVIMSIADIADDLLEVNKKLYND